MNTINESLNEPMPVPNPSGFGFYGLYTIKPINRHANMRDLMVSVRNDILSRKSVFSFAKLFCEERGYGYNYVDGKYCHTGDRTWVETGFIDEEIAESLYHIYELTVREIEGQMEEEPIVYWNKYGLKKLKQIRDRLYDDDDWVQEIVERVKSMMRQKNFKRKYPTYCY